MVCKLIYKIPLRKCECGRKPSLRCFNAGQSHYKRTMWFIECDDIACWKRISKLYSNPFIAIIKWYLKDWQYSKETNRYLKGE